MEEDKIETPTEETTVDTIESTEVVEESGEEVTAEEINPIVEE
tara:strand:+ start:263 stop:391 length:129 start_codon:yes stop_codon:yes gene_type:complete